MMGGSGRARSVIKIVGVWIRQAVVVPAASRIPVAVGAGRWRMGGERKASRELAARSDGRGIEGSLVVVWLIGSGVRRRSGRVSWRRTV